MPYIRRTGPAGQGLAVSSFLKHVTQLRYRRRMTSKSPSQLWKPGTAIRFSPKRPAQLYPDLGGTKSAESPQQLFTAAAPTASSAIDRKLFPQTTAPTREQEATNAQSSTSSISGPKAGPPGSVSSSNSSKWTFLAPDQCPVMKLEYQPSVARYDAARRAAPNVAESYWTHTLYERANADGSVNKVKVNYCTSKTTVENLCQRYFRNEAILGFDMEWQSYANRESGPRQNVSVIQLASPSRIGIFHIALFSKDDFVSPTFRKIMEDSNIIKAGINILADATRLRKVLGVNMAGVFEVSHLYNLIRFCRDRRPGPVPKSAVAMGTQVKECLGLPMCKEESVREGDWMVPLNSRKLQYAASDAYAGLQLYHVLEQHRLQLDPQPPRPYLAELRLPITRPVLEDLDSISEEEDLIDDSVTDEDMIALEEAMATDDLIPSTTVSSGTALKPAQDSRISAANSSVEKFKALAPRRVARTAALRAYYIWHNNKDLPPAEIASLLRDPPLQTNTVVTYILDAVTSEKLPYSKLRMAKEILSLVHPSAVTGRYQELSRSCNFTATTQPDKGRL